MSDQTYSGQGRHQTSVKRGDVRSSKVGRRTEYDLAAVKNAYQLIPRRLVVVDLQELYGMREQVWCMKHQDWPDLVART